MLQARGSSGPEDPLRLARWLIDAGEEIPIELMLGAARAANLAGDPQFGAALAARPRNAGAGIDAALLLASEHTVRSVCRCNGRADVSRRQHRHSRCRARIPRAAERDFALGTQAPAELRQLLERAASRVDADHVALTITAPSRSAGWAQRPSPDAVEPSGAPGTWLPARRPEPVRLLPACARVYPSEYVAPSRLVNARALEPLAVSSTATVPSGSISRRPVVAFIVSTGMNTVCVGRN
jgi:hypothetical protein